MPEISRRLRVRRLLGGAARRIDAALAAPPRPAPREPTAPRAAAPHPAAPAAPVQARAKHRRFDSVRNFLTGMGGDKVDAGRPDLWQEALTYQELSSCWRFNGYARRYVEIVPQDATRKGWTVNEGSAAIEGIDAEHRRLSVFSRWAEADSWGRLYGGAWILMVTEDDIPAEFLSNPKRYMAEPLELKRVRTLQNLVVLDWSEATPESIDSDPRSDTFGRPLRYYVNPRAGGASYTGGQIVHASRMIYFGGAILPPKLRAENNGVDDSVLQSVWDQIRNKTANDRGLAAISGEMKTSVLNMEQLADLELSDQAEYFDIRMRQLARQKSSLNMVLLGKGETYTNAAGTVSGMGELDDKLRQAMQAVTGMPEQLWIGNAPGGLSTDGESHRNLWANVISSYQTNKYDPSLRKLYEVMFAADSGPWGGTAPEEWMIQFKPLDELTEHGKADLQLKTAQTDILYIDRGVLSAEQVEQSRFGEQGWQQDIIPRSQLQAAPGGGGVNGVTGTGMGGVQEELARMEGDADPLLDPDRDDAEADPVLAERRILAEQMNEHGVDRCHHERPNRCPICGVERVRGLEASPDGSGSVWVLSWRAIGDYPKPETDPAADPLADPVEEADEDPARTDAHEDADSVSIWVGVPWHRTGLGDWSSAQLEAATIAGMTVDAFDTEKIEPHVTLLWVGDAFDTEKIEPHVTLLWVGKVPRAEAPARAAEVRKVFDELLSEHRAIQLTGSGLSASEPSPGSDGDTPVYISVWSETLSALHRIAAEKLLDDETRSTRPCWYQAHATLGYVPGQLAEERWHKLYSAISGRGEWVADMVELRVGDEITHTWQLKPMGAE